LASHERVIYNKEVQTTQVETTSLGAFEEEIRQRIMKEQDIEAERAARDKELEEESVKLEKEIEQEIRGKHTASFHSSREPHCFWHQSYPRKRDPVSLPPRSS
jgi:hypothetical protein